MRTRSMCTRESLIVSVVVARLTPEQPDRQRYCLRMQGRSGTRDCRADACQFELDSLAGFLKMSNRYYRYTKDSSFLNFNCKCIRIKLAPPKVDSQGIRQMNAILQVLHDQSEGSWDEDFNFISHYNFTGTEGSLQPIIKNSGNGEPRLANGLVASSHRPSDDQQVLPYITADNAM